MPRTCTRGASAKGALTLYHGTVDEPALLKAFENPIVLTSAKPNGDFSNRRKFPDHFLMSNVTDISRLDGFYLTDTFRGAVQFACYRPGGPRTTVAVIGVSDCCSGFPNRGTKLFGF